jgi:G2/mitotic-specific cyclin-B, other
MDETEEALEVAELLDARLANHLNDLSEILIKKYRYAFYSKASDIVVDFYQSCERFQRHPIVIPGVFNQTPLTPAKRAYTGLPPTPLSCSTSCSSIASDDMPTTPTGGSFVEDPFLVVAQSNQKENSRPSSIPAESFIKRPSLDAHLDANMYARPALQNLNGVLPSPRPPIH